MVPNIAISETALTHFRGMLENKQPAGATQLRIYVLHPGTSLGHCGIAYWHPDGDTLEDAHIGYGAFKLYYSSEEASFLDGATVDYRKSFSGHALSLQAPNAKIVRAVDQNSPLAHRITHVLETEVNPHLSEHSGTVMLSQIREGGIVTLKFGGGCHGCGHAELTLRDTVEKTLKERFPEIVAVVDETDHREGKQPYIPITA